MVSRYHQSGAKERPDTPLFVDVDGRSTLKDYDDEAITVSIHKDVRDPLDAQPKIQEIVISNAVGELLLVKLTSLGEMTLRRVGMRDVTFMHLSRGMAEALVFQAYEWIRDLERWDYEQEEKFLKKQANGHGPTQDQQEPPNPFARHAREVIREYEDGFLTAGEMSAALRAMIEDEETAEQARVLPPLEARGGPIIGMCPRCNGNMYYRDDDCDSIECCACHHILIKETSIQHSSERLQQEQATREAADNAALPEWIIP